MVRQFEFMSRAGISCLPSLSNNTPLRGWDGGISTSRLRMLNSDTVLCPYTPWWTDGCVFFSTLRRESFDSTPNSPFQILVPLVWKVPWRSSRNLIWQEYIDLKVTSNLCSIESDEFESARNRIGMKKENDHSYYSQEAQSFCFWVPRRFPNDRECSLPIASWSITFKSVLSIRVTFLFVRTDRGM
jgi:hypothetical protein